MDTFDRWQRGDDEAFNELFRRYYSTLCRSAYLILRDRQKAEDIVQDFFINFWGKRNTLNIHSHPEQYMKRAVINRSINYVKSEKRHVELPTDHINLAVQPSKGLRREDDRKAIEFCMEKLPERRRHIFILYRYEHMKYAEISEFLNLSIKTVEAHLRNARLDLRKCLEKQLSL